ncbi:MAG: hypothetical protein HEEMFOPI_00169 [Holosporales bacterium]
MINLLGSIFMKMKSGFRHSIFSNILILISGTMYGITPIPNSAAAPKPAVPGAAVLGTAAPKPAVPGVAAVPKMDDKKAKYIFDAAFGKPIGGGVFGSATKCSDAYGKINWTSAKQLQDGGQGAMIEAHVNTNIMPCLASGEVEKRSSLVNALKNSCAMGRAVTNIPIKDKVCNAAESGAAAQQQKKADAAAAQQQKKADEALFPGTVDNFGCHPPKVAPFDALKLAQFVQRNQAIVSTVTATPTQKNEATNNVKKALAYVADLQKCAKSHTDVNFNAALAAKFPTPQGAKPTCQAPVGFPNANSGLTAAIYGGPDSLCALSRETGNKIVENKSIEDAKKLLAVPSTPLGYVSFPVGLVQALTQPGATQAIATWAARDEKGFNAHFTKILQGVTSVNGKTVNPKSTALVSQACSTTLANNPNQMIQQICTAAQATHAQNSNNAENSAAIANAKKLLAVPSTPLGYVGFPVGLVKPLENAEAVQQISIWAEKDEKGFNAHFTKILQGVTSVNGKTVNRNSTEIVDRACSTTLANNPNPMIQQICTAAQATHAQNGNNAQVANFKKILGVPTVGAQYMICNRELGQKLNAEALAGWIQLDEVGASAHLNAIDSKCMTGSQKPHPELSFAINQACTTGGLSGIAEAQNLCNAAAQKSSGNADALATKIGHTDVAGMTAMHDDMVTNPNEMQSPEEVSTQEYAGQSEAQVSIQEDAGQSVVQANGVGESESESSSVGYGSASEMSSGSASEGQEMSQENMAQSEMPTVPQQYAGYAGQQAAPTQQGYNQYGPAQQGIPKTTSKNKRFRKVGPKNRYGAVRGGLDSNAAQKAAGIFS